MGHVFYQSFALTVPTPGEWNKWQQRPQKKTWLHFRMNEENPELSTFWCSFCGLLASKYNHAQLGMPSAAGMQIRTVLRGAKSPQDAKKTNYKKITEHEASSCHTTVVTGLTTEQGYKVAEKSKKLVERTKSARDTPQHNCKSYAHRLLNCLLGRPIFPARSGVVVNTKKSPFQS
jgi:hypothetical protein